MEVNAYDKRNAELRSEALGTLHLPFCFCFPFNLLAKFFIFRKDPVRRGLMDFESTAPAVQRLFTDCVFFSGRNSLVS